MPSHGTSCDAPTGPPVTDPTPLMDWYRGNHATEVLVASVAHFGVFRHLADGPLHPDQLRSRLELESRPFLVLLTALRALGTIVSEPDGRLAMSPMAAEHLVAGGAYYIGDYFSLGAASPGVTEFVERLRTNSPRGGGDQDAGVGFIYREGIRSAMDAGEGARHFTLSLAGRAKNVAPVLAERLPLTGARLLVDVGGGTGLYSLAFLRRNPGLRAVVWDRPQVLRVAAEFAAVGGEAERLELVGGDMFTDPFPAGADVVLLSNILHDWDVPEVRRLLGRCAEALQPGGRLLIHDVFLDDDLGGPLPEALYSVTLFNVTEGRAYSAAEYRGWLEEAGFGVTQLTPTLVHCAVMVAVKR